MTPAQIGAALVMLAVYAAGRHAFLRPDECLSLVAVAGIAWAGGYAWAREARDARRP